MTDAPMPGFAGGPFVGPGRAFRTPPRLSIAAALAHLPPLIPRVETPSRAAARARLARALEQGRARVILVAAMVSLGFSAVTAKLIDATVTREGNEPGSGPSAIALPTSSSRADIVDRNGVLLATSLATASVYADPALVIEPEATARKLVAELPDLGYEVVLRELKSDRRFVWLKRNLTPRQEYAVNRLGLPGIFFQREDRRVYPMGPLAAHVVGFTGIDNNGLAGIEQQFDRTLRTSREPLKLSLDTRLQHIVRRELAAAVAEFEALGGCGMIMDVGTGEVLAMVSLPDFDPQQPTENPEARFNRATLGVYEMGSIFKIFNTAMALDSGAVSIDDRFDASRPIHVGRYVIHDFENEFINHPAPLTVPEIFKFSSNIGSVHIALQAGTANQRAFMSRIGFLKPSTVELPENGMPLVPNPWRDINTMTIAFGHGMSVSPVMALTGAAAVVDGGILHPATLLKRDPGIPVPGERVISPQTSDIMRRLIRLVVAEGTAKFAEVPGYLVGGKTGTAEKVSGHSYAKHADLSSFIGMFPMNAPRYAVMITLDEPKGTHETGGYRTGGWVAAPAVGRIVKEMGPLLGVMPIDQDSPQIREAMSIALKPKGATVASN